MPDRGARKWQALMLLPGLALLLMGAANTASVPITLTTGAHLKSLLPWLNTATLVTLATIAMRLWLVSRKVRIAENKDDRDGYGVLITALQEDVKSVRAALAIEQEAHRTCEGRLNKIEGELMGFHRQALIQSQQGVAQLPASVMVKEAGERAVAASRGPDE